MQSVIAGNVVLLLLIISSCGLEIFSKSKGFIPIISFISFFTMVSALIIAVTLNTALDEIFIVVLIMFVIKLAPSWRKGNEL